MQGFCIMNAVGWKERTFSNMQLHPLTCTGYLEAPCFGGTPFECDSFRDLQGSQKRSEYVIRGPRWVIISLNL